MGSPSGEASPYVESDESDPGESADEGGDVSFDYALSPRSNVFQRLLQDSLEATIPLDGTDETDPNIVPNEDLVGLDSGSDCEDLHDESAEEDGFSDSSESDGDDGEHDEEEDARDDALDSAAINRMLATFLSQMHEHVEGSSSIFNEEELRSMSKEGWTRVPDDSCASINESDPADKKYDGYCGPSEDIEDHAHSSMSLFYYFLPRSFWTHVASESNRYWRQTIDGRVDEAFRRQQAKEQANPYTKRLTRLDIETKMLKFKKIQPNEIIQYIGLLLAHTMCPHKRMRSHWGTSQVGALPAGTFGSVMSRDRFQTISRFLHFSDNKAPQASTDRAWKIRPVLNTMEKTFKQGYVLGYRVALDEGMLPSRNRHNPTRTYMKDKPHKWGSKCVLTCCATTGYCKRCVESLRYAAAMSHTCSMKGGVGCWNETASRRWKGQRHEEWSGGSHQKCRVCVSWRGVPRSPTVDH